MSGEIKLYDTRKNDFPKNGSPFRTLQVFRCDICLYKTNLASYSAMAQPGIGGRILVPCKYSKECWHHELQDAITKVSKLYAGQSKKMLSYKIEEQQISHLACLSYEIESDVLGDVDNKQIIEIWQNRVPANTLKPCIHCDPAGFFNQRKK